MFSRFNALEHAKGIAASPFRIVLADSGMGQPSSMMTNSLFSRPPWLVQSSQLSLLQEAAGARELSPAQ